MKKIIAAILASIFIAAPAFAAGNVVYIYEADGKIYYDSERFDDRFMIHENMVPGGQTYTDVLTVENGTSKGYDIYFKISAENNSAKADNLIEHIEMKIYLDGDLFYDGKARGLDYRSQGVDLSDAVKIGTFNPGDSKEMRVETYLDAAYDDINNPDTSLTHWHFYVTDPFDPDPGPGPEPEPTPTPDEPVVPEEIVPNPRTNDEFTPWFLVLLGASLALFLLITIRERVEHKKRAR